MPGANSDRVAVSVSVFTVTNPGEADFVRSQIAFYASTPSYRPVLELHGRGEVADRLGALARRGAWAEMPAQIDDDLLGAIAVVADEASLGDALRSRYRGLADRITLYRPFRPGEQDGAWRALSAALAG